MASGPIFFSWGDPADFGTGPSSLEFTGAAIETGFGDVFSLGTLTFFNGIIAGGGATAVDLEVTIMLTMPSGVTHEFIKTLTLINTPNTEDPIESADIVFLPTSFPSLIFAEGDNAFEFRIIGFGNVTGSGFATIDSFNVLEGESATAELLGTIEAIPDGVSLSEDLEISNLHIASILAGAVLQVGISTGFCFVPELISLAICGGALLIVYVDATITVIELSNIFNDPPEPDFSTIFIPNDFVPVTLEPSGVLPTDVEDRFNVTFAAQTNLYELIQAWRVTLERYNAAVVAGDMDAAEMQLAAMETFIRAASLAARSANQSLVRLIDALEPLLGPVEISESEVEEALADLAENGLGPIEQELFEEVFFGLGLSEVDIASVVDQWLVVDPAEVPNELFAALRDLAKNYVDLAILTTCVGGVCVESVAIDIKPGENPNSINPESTGVIPVAILTTDVFDATTVDPMTVRFGPIGAMEAHGQGHIEDANEDGDLDLVVHFDTQETGILCSDTSTTLTGETFGGEAIVGSDSIRTVGCK